MFLELLKKSLFLLLLACRLNAQAPLESEKLIVLRGHLDSEAISEARKVLEGLSGDKSEQLLITVNSGSGNLNQVIDLATAIYSAKIANDIRVIVYIDDKALGPAAVIPFLADELYTSLVVSWGDVSLNATNTLPVNVLRNRVIGLISEKNEKADVLKVLASAMCDKTVQVAKLDEVWKIANRSEELNFAISPSGEALVINQNQIRELGLARDTLSFESFKNRFRFSLDQQVILKSAETPQGLAITTENLDKRLKEFIKSKSESKNLIGRVVIDDRTSGINQGTWLYVKKALDYYKESKPLFIILELNTPGGEVFSAQKISDALKEMDTQYNIPCVAYINNWAISAGAMLAYSCRFITVVKDGAMGAAEPVIAGESGEMKAASEKVNSALRADFANRAQFFDRNPLIAEAMVDKDILLVLRHGKIVKLDNENQVITTGSDPDLIISAKGKLLTLSADHLLKFGVADFILQPRQLTPITEQEREKGEWPAAKSLLFQEDFFKNIPNAWIDEYKMDWRTQFFVFLANPIVSSALFLGMLLGFYMEFNGGGFGIAGSVAVTCLFLIILSSFALEIGNLLELILLIVGLAFVLVEVFVLPTVGLLGIVGAIFFIIGLFGLMLPGIGSVEFEFDTNSFNAAGEVFFERLGWLSGTIVVAAIIMALLGRLITRRFGAWNRFVLKGGEQVDYKAVEDETKLPSVGEKGEVIATLRPAGKVMIKDVLYEAISQGNLIEKGEIVVVIGNDSGALIVIRDQSDIEKGDIKE